jgi:CTP synthase (UTP-ammonia lyase)
VIGRFGLDPTYRRLLHDAGLRIAGVDGGDGDARVMRHADHPFYA